MDRIKNTFYILSIILLLLHTASATAPNPQSALMNMSEVEFLSTFQNEINAIGSELGVDLNKLEPSDIVVVIGERLSAAENAGLAVAQARSSNLSLKIVYSSDVNLSYVEKNSRIVILVGGPSQNTITEELEKEGALTGKSHEFMNQFVIQTGKTKYGTRVAVISDKRGFSNIPRRGAQYSPLALCLPLQLIPIVASIIGAFLISLIAPVSNILKAYIEAWIASRGKERKKISENAIKVFGVRIREVVSIVAAALVLSISVTWTFAGPTFDFIWLLFLNTIICLLAGLSHEIMHWLMGKFLKIETEYRLWKSGSIATLFTAFLGNSFGLQGFLLEKVPEGTPKWKLGVMKLSSPILSTMIMIFFALVNFLFPHVTFQMIYNIAGLLAMVDILPFKPMDGEEVRKWNILIWLIAFMLISASFTIVTFIL